MVEKSNKIDSYTTNTSEAINNMDVYKMETLDATLEVLNQKECCIISGGTDVMVRNKGKRGTKSKIKQPVVFISHLEALRNISKEGDTIYIGAACTYTELIDSPLVPQMLKNAIKTIGAPAIRNRGTIGGNICNASPVGDTLPLLYLYDTKLRLKSAKGERLVSIKDYILAPSQTVKEKNELLVEIILSKVYEEQTHYVFEKVGSRKADAISKISFAGSIRLNKNTIASAHFAFGAVGPKIVYSETLERLLLGKNFPLKKEDIDDVVKGFDEIIHTIDDQRSTAAYRKKVALNLLKHFLQTKEIKKRVVYKGHIIHTPTIDGIEVHKNHYLIVENGCVKAIKETLDSDEEQYPLVDCSDRLIIPGFVDLHLHASQYDQIGLGLDLQLIDWLKTYTFKLESRFDDTAYAENVYRKFVNELALSGTTRSCIFATIHKNSTKVLMELLSDKGLCAYVGKVNMNQNSIEELSESTEQSIEDTKSLIEETSHNQEVKPIITPRFAPSCSDELLTGLGKLVREYNIPVQSHLSENKEEIQWVSELFPDRKHYSDAYDHHGLFGETKTLMAHGVYLTDEELELIKEKNVMLVHCPDSNMNIKSGIMPMKRYLKAGISIGLGSDVGGGSKLSITSAIVSAIQNSKILGLETGEESLKFHEAFYMATKGGGRFFGAVGSFEKGSAFDALIVDMREDTHETLTPKEQLMRFVYRDKIDCIQQRFCNGKRI